MKGKQRFGAAKRKSGTATAMWSRNRQAEENGSPIRNPRLTGPDAGNGGRAMKAGSPVETTAQVGLPDATSITTWSSSEAKALTVQWHAKCQGSVTVARSDKRGSSDRPNRPEAWKA